ncbi:PEP-CTERM sorting domain-containing protein [Armatimonas sp.]|uniref:PEP-CTERM sorting domain-containing protein n=1 Tax=Armatimonas sp. TaxID=1872638 RepID=UPI0037534DAB
MKRLSLTALTLGLFLLGATAQAQTFNATTDFSSTNGNPNGQWSYGFTTTLGGALTLFDTADSSPTLPRWTHSIVQNSGTPTILRNNTGVPVNGVPTGFLLVHPGSSEYFVLRFTVPSTANYSILAQGLVGDIGDTDLSVLRNSNAGVPLFFAPTTNTNPTFSSTLALTAGDTVDFVVGNKGSFFADSTGAVFTLTTVGGASAPEPGSIALFTTGGLIWIIRRRQNA